MTMLRIGDLSQHLASLRHGTALRRSLAQHTAELSTGRLSDLPRSLGAAQERTASLSFRLGEISDFLLSARSAARLSDGLQRGLDRINGLRGKMAARLMDPMVSRSSEQVASHSEAARAAFSDATAALNGSIGGRHIFAGTAQNNPPLMGAEAHLTAITAHVASLTDAAAVEAAVMAWFVEAGGGYETSALQGNDQSIHLPLDHGTTIRLPPGAAHGVVRKVLGGLALAALAGDMSLPLDDATRQELLMRAGQRLHTDAASITALMSEIGTSQSRIEAMQDRLGAEQTELSIQYNDDTRIDMEGTATRIQSLQVQLEAHYTLVSRLSRLSLAGLS